MITELTKEQEDLMRTVRDEWIDIGLATGKASEADMRATVDACYTAAKLRLPEHYYYFDSPKAGALAVALLKLQNPADLDDIEPYSQETLTEKVSELMQTKPLPKDIAKHAQEAYRWVCHGQHESGWLSRYDYFQRLGIDGLEPLEGLKQAARCCGWWWPLESIAVVTHRPIALYRDDNGALHREDGMAIRYADGWGLYCWHGINVPEHFILRPETITDRDIERIETKARKTLAEKQQEPSLDDEDKEASRKAALKEAERTAALLSDFRRAMQDRRAAAAPSPSFAN